jgi:small-conductance mechanosensitive channel
LRSEILLAIWDAFEQHGILPPYPQQEVLMRGPLPQLPTADQRTFTRDGSLTIP